MSVPFGQLQNPNYIPLYKYNEGPSMCELYYFLKQLYNYEPALIHIIKQFIFTKSSPLNKEYISIWEVYAFYFNYQLTEKEYLKLCHNDIITRFWRDYNTIIVVNRHRGSLINTWEITFKDIHLVYDYCKKYYLKYHNKKINNYMTLIKLILLEIETKDRIKDQEYLIELQELDCELVDKLITKEEYDKKIGALIKNNNVALKFLKLYQQECYNKCENIRTKILSIKQNYDKLDTHILRLK